MKRNTFTQTHKSGFTLIEVMVAVSIFAIIATIGIGAVVSSNKSFQLARSQRQGIDSLGFILDSVSRSVRTGSQYGCNGATTRDCAAAADLYYVDQENCLVVLSYSQSDGTLTRKRPEPGCSDPFVTLNDPTKVFIDDALFYVRGTDVSDTDQPIVTIFLKAHSGSGNARQSISLQTSVTQRILDVPPQ